MAHVVETFSVAEGQAIRARLAVWLLTQGDLPLRGHDACVVCGDTRESVGLSVPACYPCAERVRTLAGAAGRYGALRDCLIALLGGA